MMSHGDAEDIHDRLYWSASDGNVAEADKLLSLGADVNATAPSSGLTPLHAAAAKGHFTMVAHLLNNGADATLGNSYGMTPLHAACRGGVKQVVVKLLDAGADPHKKDKGGKTASDVAIEGGHTAVAALLNQRALADLVSAEARGRRRSEGDAEGVDMPGRREASRPSAAATKGSSSVDMQDLAEYLMGMIRREFSGAVLKMEHQVLSSEERLNRRLAKIEKKLDVLHETSVELAAGVGRANKAATAANRYIRRTVPELADYLASSILTADKGAMLAESCNRGIQIARDRADKAARNSERAHASAQRAERAALLAAEAIRAAHSARQNVAAVRAATAAGTPSSHRRHVSGSFDDLAGDLETLSRRSFARDSVLEDHIEEGHESGTVKAGATQSFEVSDTARRLRDLAHDGPSAPDGDEDAVSRRTSLVDDSSSQYSELHKLDSRERAGAVPDRELAIAASVNMMSTSAPAKAGFLVRDDDDASAGGTPIAASHVDEIARDQPEVDASQVRADPTVSLSVPGDDSPMVGAAVGGASLSEMPRKDSLTVMPLASTVLPLQSAKSAPGTRSVSQSPRTTPSDGLDPTAPATFPVAATGATKDRLRRLLQAGRADRPTVAGKRHVDKSKSGVLPRARFSRKSAPRAQGAATPQTTPQSGSDDSSSGSDTAESLDMTARLSALMGGVSNDEPRRSSSGRVRRATRSVSAASHGRSGLHARPGSRDDSTVGRGAHKRLLTQLEECGF